MFAEIVRGMWEELPEAEGARLYAAQLAKGAGHKYIRRVPKPGGGYRYYYRVTGGKGLAHDDEIVEGAKFKVRGGHYHVEEVVGDRVKVVHDETGRVKYLKRHTLRAVLHHEHREKIKEARSNAEDVRRRALIHGSEKQKRRAREALRRVQGVEALSQSPRGGRAPRGVMDDLPGGVKVEGRGRRVYFTGDTYAIKDVLRENGARWDAKGRQWWMGKPTWAKVHEDVAGSIQSPEEGAAERAIRAYLDEPRADAEAARRAEVRRKVDAERAARRREFETAPATAKQVDFAMDLLARLPREDEVDSDAVTAFGRPSREQLQGYTRQKISRFIDTLRDDMQAIRPRRARRFW